MLYRFFALRVQGFTNHSGLLITLLPRGATEPSWHFTCCSYTTDKNLTTFWQVTNDRQMSVQLYGRFFMYKHGDVRMVLDNLRGAQSIAMRIHEAGYRVERTELKRLLADITSSIAGAKMELSILQGNIDHKDSELLRLNDILTNRSQLRRRGDAYYKTIEGRPYGQPFCSYCWEKESAQYHLHNRILSKDVRVCPCCKNEYQAHRTPFFDSEKMPV